MDNAEDWKVTVSDSCRLGTHTLLDYLDSPYNPLTTPLNISEFVAHHKIEDTTQNTAEGIDTTTPPPPINEGVNVIDTSPTSPVSHIQLGHVEFDNDSFLESNVLIDLPDFGFLDEIIIDSPGWQIEADRNKDDKGQCRNYLKRILQDVMEAKAQVHDLRSELAISEANYGANREAVAGLNETMVVQLKTLTDKADRILEKADDFMSSCSLEMQTIKELLASQGARLDAMGTITNADVGPGNAIPRSENMSIVVPDNRDQQPMINVDEEVNENVIECPPQSRNIQSSQPSTSRLPPSTTLYALRDISNNQRVSSVHILQNQPDEGGGRAERGRIVIYETTGPSNHDNGGRAMAKEACKNCSKVLSKYYLNKLNGHRKHCKPKVSS